MKIKSNAKVNLYLNVYDKENDLHLIESLMVPISLYDEIEINENNYDVIEGMDIDLKSNIMYKALCLFRERYNTHKKYKIRINKNIPIGAGLGGGSGNAAEVLKFLSKENNVNKNEILKLSKKVGSDVSFFIENKPAILTGTGDKIYLCEVNKLYGVLVFDDDYVSTKESYIRLDGMEREYKESPLGIMMYSNDLELALKDEMKNKIESIKEILLKQGAYFSLMNGSGGSVYGLFKSEDEALKCKESIINKYKNVFVFHTL